MKLYKGDCLQEMKKIESNSVDAIITDPPYGTTNRNNWDSVIDLKLMWEQLNRIIKPNGAIVLFCNEPFTSVLISSNLKGFKYRWDWNKKIPSGMGYAKYRPMQQTEDIAVFTKDGKKTIYNPQMIKRDKPIKAGGNNIGTMNYGVFNAIENKKEYKKTYDYKNPITLIEFDKIRKGALHPTQKPVPLMEYLIKTYTNENEIVLDFTMGSGSTGVACKNINRDFIGIEMNDEYYDIACKRIGL
jgi:site-specific DNA-methyltransferase (adenine-specific)